MGRRLWFVAANILVTIPSPTRNNTIVRNSYSRADEKEREKKRKETRNTYVCTYVRGYSMEDGTSCRVSNFTSAIFGQIHSRPDIINSVIKTKVERRNVFAQFHLHRIFISLYSWRGGCTFLYSRPRTPP